jgi:hypothetical protein
MPGPWESPEVSSTGRTCASPMSCTIKRDYVHVSPCPDKLVTVSGRSGATTTARMTPGTIAIYEYTAYKELDRLIYRH